MDGRYDELLLIAGLAIRDDRVRNRRPGRVEEKLAFRLAYHVLSNGLDPYEALIALRESNLIDDGLDMMLFEECYWRYIDLLRGR